VSFPQETLSTLCDEVVVGHVGPSSGHRLNDGIPFLMGKNIGEGFLKLDDLERVTPEFHRSQKKSQLRPGDIAVVRIGKSGLAAKIPETLGEANCSGLVVIKRPRKVAADYLVHFLNSPEGRRQSLAEAKGSTRQTLNTRSIAAAEIPVPPLAEQRRIAEVLDRAEALRAKRRAALAQLDSLTQSLFLDLFGDPATNAKGVSIESLGNHLLFVTSGGRGWAKFYAPIGSRFIRSLDVQMNHIGSDDIAFVAVPDNAEARRTRVKAGDVLLTITGSRIGRVAPVPSELEGSFISQHVAILRVDSKRIEPSFLSFFLSFEAGGQRQIAKAQYGQTKPGLNFEQIKRFQVPVPPIELQREFAHRIGAVEKLKTAQRASLAEMDALFASLQHRAFRGEL
jgi:type I restriction enzyme S subunit